MRTQDMINVDEAGFKIETTNPRFGKTVLWLLCYLEGEYNRDKKVNFLWPSPLIRTITWSGIISGHKKKAGQICFRCMCFFRGLLFSWQSTFLVDLFCFTVDNLNTHKHPMVLGLITGGSHRYLVCAPYWSVNGPIEYIFNTIHTKLLSFFGEIDDLDMLETYLNKLSMIWLALRITFTTLVSQITKTKHSIHFNIIDTTK